MGSFSAFALLAAFVQSSSWMNITCGLLGLSSAMVVPSAAGILGAAYSTPSRRKNLAFAAFSSGTPAGFAVSVLSCGAAAQLSSWRASFVLVAVLYFIFTVTSFWCVPEERKRQGSFRERAIASSKKIDYIGSFQTIIGVGSFTAALTCAHISFSHKNFSSGRIADLRLRESRLGPTDTWQSPHVISLLVIGILLLASFVLWQRVCQFPLMPLHVWKDRNFAFVCHLR